MEYQEICEFYRTRMGVKNESTVKRLAENTRCRQFRRGERLLVEGEDMATVCFHLNGAAKCYTYDEKGNECVMGFCKNPGGACIGASGIQEKVDFTIEALTDTDTLILPISVLSYVIRHDPDAAEVYHQLLIADHDQDYKLQIALQTMKGRERYQWFLKEYADIAELVPQKDIASFLCMKPQSLSRIKVAMEQEK